MTRSEFGAENLEWHEPPDDSAMQDAIYRALRGPLGIKVIVGGKPGWRCGVCGTGIVEGHFKRHLKKHDRQGFAKSIVDEAWREFLEAAP